MLLTVQGVGVNLPGVQPGDITAIEANLKTNLASSAMKGRTAIAEAFRLAVSLCPHANASDLWHHVIYRAYLRLASGTNPNQSWVRTSGDAFETWIAQTYNEALAPHGLELVPLFSHADRAKALSDMGIANQVGSAKLDLALYEVDSLRNRGQILGGIHAKASLAERVSDDVPASQIMMRAGYFSPLVTLDVKSFPPPRGDLVNRGELGTPATPSDKRDYIEKHGSFSACYSYNDRTVPSNGTTASGRSIYVTHASDPVADHQLFKDLVAWVQ